MKYFLWTIVAALALGQGTALAREPDLSDRLDLLVVAPHSDDEAIA